MHALPSRHLCSLLVLAALTPCTPSDADHDGYITLADCDDADPATHPGAVDLP